MRDKIKSKAKRLWAWLRKNVFCKDMFLSFVIAELIFWSPCIFTGLMAIIFNPWWWTPFGLICAFWAGPFTPAVPLQIGLAIGIKKLSSAIKRKIKNNKEKEKNGGRNQKPPGDGDCK